MNVHVSVNESHCSDLLVLKLPDVDLHRRGGGGRERESKEGRERRRMEGREEGGKEG